MVAKVISFTDLEVYKRLYKLSLIVHKKVIPKLPDNEKFGLKDQLNRSTKAPCAILAEGYARRKTGKQWKKYIRDAIGECNETIVHLSFARDLYSKNVDVKLCNKLISVACKRRLQASLQTCLLRNMRFLRNSFIDLVKVGNSNYNLPTTYPKT